MKYFGTDGVRGRFGVFPITSAFFKKLAQALERCGRPKQVMIGRDTRASGTAILEALAHGFSENVVVLDLGIVTSPLLSKAVRDSQSDFGLMITASHNPASDNGVKIFDAQGEKIQKTLESELELAIDQLQDADASLSQIRTIHVQPKYVLPKTVRKRFPKVVIDGANGSVVEFACQAYDFEHVTWIGNCPDGTNINQNCGSEHPEALQTAVRQMGASLGIAHDGDGDRVLMCDETGKIISGEAILGIIAIDLQKQRLLKGNAIVTTEMSNQGLIQSLEPYGIQVFLSDVGDRNVAAVMHEKGCVLGGENSGHVILFNEAPTSDGIQTALHFLEAVTRLDIPLSEVDRVITLLPKKMCSLPVRQKIPLTELPELNNIIQFEAEQLRNQGKVFVRYSGTEPKLRLLVEAPTERLAEEILTKIRNGVVNCKKIA